MSRAPLCKRSGSSMHPARVLVQLMEQLKAKQMARDAGLPEPSFKMTKEERRVWPASWRSIALSVSRI